MGDLKNAVLVTGASRGIGRAIAVTLAKRGYDVVAHCRQDIEGLDETLAQLRQHGLSDPRHLCFDVANREQVADVLAQDVEQHGAYYGVVCNAGIHRDNAFPLLSGEDWDAVIRTDLDGFYNVLQPIVMPMIRRKKPGRVVAISSVSGLLGNRGQVNYSAAKAGLIGATKALALELAKRKITVNCVAPGLIETGMTDDLPEDLIIKQIPMRRIGKPSEVAETVGFLMSEHAAYITRQVIAVDGGLS